MSRLGDLVARLALGRNPLLRGEVEELRLQMNTLQSTMSKVAEWAGNRESLSAPSIASRTARFDSHTHQPCVFDLRSSEGQALAWGNHIVGGAVTGATLTAGAPSLNHIHSVPLVVRKSLRIEAISFNVTVGGGAGSVARAGIYTNHGRPASLDFRPGTLVVDGGEQDTSTTGSKSTTIDVLLASDTVYWLVYLAGVGAPTIKTIPGSACAAIGFTGATGIDYNIGHKLNYAYAALPSSADLGGHGLGTDEAIPAIFLKINRVGKDP